MLAESFGRKLIVLVPCCLALPETHSMLTSYPKEPETIFSKMCMEMLLICLVSALFKGRTCNATEGLVLDGNFISNRKIVTQKFSEPCSVIASMVPKVIHHRRQIC